MGLGRLDSVLTGPCALGSDRKLQPPREFGTVSQIPGAGSERPSPAVPVGTPRSRDFGARQPGFQPLCASVSSAVKWDSGSTHLSGGGEN